MLPFAKSLVRQTAKKQRGFPCVADTTIGGQAVPSSAIDILERRGVSGP